MREVSGAIVAVVEGECGDIVGDEVGDRPKVRVDARDTKENVVRGGGSGDLEDLGEEVVVRRSDFDIGGWCRWWLR